MATRASARYEIKAVDKTKAAFRRIGKSLSAMKDQAKRATIAIAAVGAAGAIAVGALAKKALQSAAGLKQLSTQTGLATNDLQQLQAMLVAVGKGDQAADTIRDVWEALGEAKTEPGGEKGKAFERLGIDPAKIKNAMQLFSQFSKAYNKALKAGATDQFFFNVKDLSDSAGEAIAAIGGDFEKLKASTKGTIFSPEAIDRASKSMREWRTLMFEITKAMQNGILNSGAMKEAQAALTQIAKVLGKEGVAGALAEVVNILIEKFPKATELVFDQLAQAKKDIEDIARVKNQVGTAIGTGAGVASEFVRQGPAKDAGVLIEIMRQVLQAVTGTEKNTRTITWTAG